MKDYISSAPPRRPRSLTYGGNTIPSATQGIPLLRAGQAKANPIQSEVPRQGPSQVASPPQTMASGVSASGSSPNPVPAPPAATPTVSTVADVNVPVVPSTPSVIPPGAFEEDFLTPASEVSQAEPTSHGDDDDFETDTPKPSSTDIDRLFIRDPRTLAAVVRVWNADTRMSGTHSSGPCIDLDVEQTLNAPTVVLVLAGHVIARAGESFQADAWNKRLRKALKELRQYRLGDARLRDAIDWLLSEGLASVGADADGHCVTDNLDEETRVRTVQQFLLNNYASQYKTDNAVELPLALPILTEIGNLTLVPASPQVSPSDEWKPFPTHLLPQVVAEFVTRTAESKLVDPAMVALPALTALGACIGTTRRIMAKDDWGEFTIIWSADINTTGSMKTPAFDAVGSPLTAMQAEADADYRQKKATYEHQMRLWRASQGHNGEEGEGDHAHPPGNPPTYRHVLTTDPTVEALGSILSTTPRGVIVFKDELSDLVGNFNAYKKTGSDLTKYLEFFNGGRVKIDRKTQEPQFIERAAVWITGTIQPGTFWSAMAGHEEDGFLGRFLITLPPTKDAGWSDAVVPPCVTEAWDATLRRLRDLDFVEVATGEEFGTKAEPVVVQLMPEAQERFKTFCNDLATRTSQLSDPALCAAWRKMRGYALKLALVLHLVEEPIPTTTHSPSETETSAPVATGGVAPVDAAPPETAPVIAAAPATPPAPVAPPSAMSDPAPVMVTPEIVSPRKVTRETMERAIALAEWFAAETRRVYSLRGEMCSAAPLEQAVLVNYIRRKGGTVDVRYLTMNVRRFNKKSQFVVEELQALVDAGLGHWVVADKKFALSKPAVAPEAVPASTETSAPPSAPGSAGSPAASSEAPPPASSTSDPDPNPTGASGTGS